MRNKIILCLFLILQSWLMVGCGQIDSDQVDQSEIFTSYSGLYSEESGDLKITATLSVGGQFGSQVWLTDKSSLSVDGHPMSSDDDVFKVIQYKYSSSRSTHDFPETFRVRYSNEDEQVFENILDMPSGVDFFLVSQLSKSSGGTLKWKLRNYSGKKENLEITVKDTRGKSFNLHPYVSESQGSVYLEPHRLKELDGNYVYISFCRSRFSSSIHSPEVGGNIRVKYCTREQRYEVQDWESNLQ
ncbi:MAG: hypothetical protein KC493_06060 [Bacteriovoracaceae bacterium]|nr:hypothetical protein [Bacteriovoracaceae bacterium]